MTESSSQPAPLPLQGVVVADFSRILAGPLCTMVLADLGADVIKIERPGTGDDTRTWGPPFVGDDAAYFLSINRNKRSVALDLALPDDARTARDIADRSDVLVENFRSDVMDRLGLDHDSVAATNPRLIYCSMPAFAHPESRNRPGYDLMMQALSGFMSITGEPGGAPVKIGVAILDVVAGLYAAVGILAALHERAETGSGRRIEVGLFEASVAGLVNQAANYLIGGTVPTPSGNAHPNIVPYQAFPAKDGQLVLAAANDKLFGAACRSIGRADLADERRYATNATRVEHREELIAEMSGTFRTATVEHWVAVLSDAGVPAAPIRSLDQVFESPEGRAVLVEAVDPRRGSFPLVKSPVSFGGDGTVHTPPRLDEHGEEIRAWIRSTPPRGVD
ncbi:MAG TPA: CoA transferase [Acidimicrobiia bacterium]|nr:CoA transferase [Acidimicrobiia bacterium]